MAEVERLRGALARIEALVWYEPDDDDDLVEAVRAMARERDEARRDLGEILAVIHRDGGHHTGEHGLSQSVADAHATWAVVVRERDEARADVARMKVEEAQGVRDYLDLRDAADKAISERERAKDACNAYWHDLTRIALLCAQTDDEYPLKAVERTVRERDEARAEVERLRAALYGFTG